MRYNGFLSYSHAADGKLAPAVQAGLHKLARPWYRLRSLWIFRDKTSLSATPSLWPSIELALSRSDYFLLMASPQAALSPWVQQEVSWWLANRSASNILILLTEGELSWLFEEADFDWQQTTALPYNLRSQFPRVPLWVDLRWARSEEKLSLRHLQFRSAILDIAATLRDKPKDLLDGDDVRVYKRNRAAAITAILATLAFAIAASYAGNVARNNAFRADKEAASALANATLAKKNEMTAERNAKEAEERRNEAVAAQVAANVAAQRADAARKNAEEQAKIATSGKLAATALLKKQSEPDVAALLSAEADRFFRTADSRNAILSTIQWNSGLAAYLRYPSSVQAIALTPDGQMLASATGTHIELWDAVARRPLGKPLVGHIETVYALAFSPDGKRLASGSYDGEIRLWDVSTGCQLGRSIKAHAAGVTDLIFRGDGKVLGSASEDWTIRLWDLDRQELVHSLEGHTRSVSRIALSPDGRTLASGSLDGTIRLWNATVGTPIKTVSAGNGAIIHALAFSPDGQLLAVADDLSVRLWDASTLKLYGQELKHQHSVVAVIFEQPSTLVSATEDSVIHVWNIQNGHLLRKRAHHNQRSVHDSTFAANGRLWASGGFDGVVRIWDEKDTFPERDLIEDDPDLTCCVSFNADGKLLAFGSGQNVRLWNISSQHLTSSKVGSHNAGVVRSIAFSPANPSILASGSSEGEIRLWNVSDGRLIGRYFEPTEAYPIRRLAFSSNGRYLAFALFTKVIIIDAMSGAAIREFHHDKTVSTLTFSPNDTVLASAGEDHTIRFWDIATGSAVGTTLHATSEDLAFSPDGRMLASAEIDNSVQLWNLENGARTSDRLLGHSSYVQSLAFTRDGKTLISGSYDGTVRLWDVDTRQPLGNPFDAGQPDPANIAQRLQVAVSPDGRLVAAAGFSNEVGVWSIASDLWLAQVCRLTNRNLSSGEWRTYVGAAFRYHSTCPEKPAP